MTTAYLVDNPPVRSQFRATRRAAVTGAIVAHTAESMLDTVGPDTGAENVARFIRGRSDAGSYHVIVDSDSIVRLVPFEAEAFGARTGNPWALHLSFACRAADWPTMAPAQGAAMIANGARAAAEMARWCRDVHGITVPGTIINDAQYRLGRPGFISHAAVDPGRRSDPGRGFPWAEFLAAFNREMETPTMTDRTNLIAQWQRAILAHGADLGTTGPDRNGADGDFGPATLAASVTVLDDLTAKVQRLVNDQTSLAALIGEAESRAKSLATELADARANLMTARADLDELRRRPASELVDALAVHVRHMATLLEDRP